jgi:hypothetical protein
MKACMIGAMSVFAATMVILALTVCGGGSSVQEESKARPLPQDPCHRPCYRRQQGAHPPNTLLHHAPRSELS